MKKKRFHQKYFINKSENQRIEPLILKTFFKGGGIKHPECIHVDYKRFGKSTGSRPHILIMTTGLSLTVI